MLRHLSLSLSILLTATGAPQAKTLDALRLAPGTWEIEPRAASDPRLSNYDTLRCDAHPLRIEIDREAGTYTSWQVDKPETRLTADIIEDLGDRFWIKYRGETRRMDNGELHVWMLVMTNEDHFIWVRQDWQTDTETIQNATYGRRRCRLAVS